MESIRSAVEALQPGKFFDYLSLLFLLLILRSSELEGKLRKEIGIVSLVRAKKKLGNQVWSEAEQEQLVAAAVECSDLSEEIRKKELEIKLDKRRTFRSRKSNIDNQFWNLARRVEKKKGLLSAINDCDGKLVTEFLQLKDTVVTEMAKVSMGQTSKIFYFPWSTIVEGGNNKE